MTDDEIDEAVKVAHGMRIPCLIFPNDAMYDRYRAIHSGAKAMDCTQANTEMRELAVRLEKRGGCPFEITCNEEVFAHLERALR